MTFRLSNQSLNRLNRVHPNLTAVVKRAIELTSIDFGVIEGFRTLEKQREYFDSGRSQTMNSKHLPQRDGLSHAVDLMAYVGGGACWEPKVYDEICDAMAKAARENGVAIRWGGAWSEGDIRDYAGSAEDAMNAYIDLRRSEGRRPFIDAPHFEMVSV